jgi:hypothetical protein
MAEKPHSAHTTELRQAFEDVGSLGRGEGATIGHVQDRLRERGFLVGLLFLTAPFLFPLPTMGLSTPVGAMVMLVGVALSLGRKPWIPGFVSRRRVSHALLTRLAASSTRALDRINAWLRPRWRFMFWPGCRLCIGISLVSAGFMLSLPLPIPFTNAIPAAAILLLSLGYLVGDGVIVLLGHGVGVGGWGYLYVVGDVAWLAIRSIFGM